MAKNKMHALKLNPKKASGWLKIGVIGQWEGHNAGMFELDERDYAQMIFNAQQRALDIVVDYEHATIYNPEKAPAAGWIEIADLKAEEGNLYCKIKWTPTATKHINEGEYKYLSPVFTANSYDQVTDKNIGWTLHSVALTNKPFLSGLDAITNKQPQHKEKDMPKSLQEQLDAQIAQNTQLKQEVVDLKAKVTDQETTIAASSKAATDAIIAASIHEGKLDKGQKTWAQNYALSDNKGFQEYMNTLTVKSPAPQGEMFDNSDKKNSAATAAINMTQV